MAANVYVKRCVGRHVLGVRPGADLVAWQLGLDDPPLTEAEWQSLLGLWRPLAQDGDSYFGGPDCPHSDVTVAPDKAEALAEAMRRWFRERTR
jgi:hypothetical protein